MDKKRNISGQLTSILSKAVDSKIYGSVEIYFEAGKVTQITQRIINKITGNPQTNSEVKKNHQAKQKPGIIKTAKSNSEIDSTSATRLAH